MKFVLLLMVLMLVACSKPTAPDSPDSSTYGQIIQGEDVPPADRFAPEE